MNLHFLTKLAYFLIVPREGSSSANIMRILCLKKKRRPMDPLLKSALASDQDMPGSR